jgi:hypothetical protein
MGAFNVSAFSGDPVLFFTWLLDRAENDAVLQSTRWPVSNRRKLNQLPLVPCAGRGLLAGLNESG